MHSGRDPGGEAMTRRSRLSSRSLRVRPARPLAKADPGDSAPAPDRTFLEAWCGRPTGGAVTGTPRENRSGLRLVREDDPLRGREALAPGLRPSRGAPHGRRLR